jgi:hypothetical protein
MADNHAAVGTSGTEGTQSGHQTDSHSALFGLEGQKRASTTAGAGAGSGVIGTSGHSGAANKSSSFAAAGQDSAENTTAGMAHGGKSSTVPGSGSEPLIPSQGSGDVPPK